MRQADHDILDRLRALSATLTQRTMLLARAHDDVNVFAEGLRDLGHDLHDTADAALTRVADIDTTDGVPTGEQTDRAAEISTTLATLTDALHRDIGATVTPLPEYEPAASPRLSDDACVERS